MQTITSPSDYETIENKIPNAISGNAGEGINGDLDSIIKKYEKKMLLNVLDYNQYTTLQTELEKQPFVSGATLTANPIWVSFVNGDGEWMGLKPILLNYVYCNWLRANEVKVTTTGAGKAKVKNYSTTDYNQKYVDRWNELADCVNVDLYNYLHKSTDINLGENYPFMDLKNSFGL